MIRLLVVATLLILGYVIPVFSQSGVYTYVWNPRTRDISAPGTKEYDLLRALLALSKVVRYSVTSGDNIDYVIRKQYLVSQQDRNAYSLYLGRLLELNPNLHVSDILHTGDRLQIPVGPRFGGTTIEGDLTDNEHSAMFSKLATAAYSLGYPTEAKIRTFSARSLSAYLLPSKAAGPLSQDSEKNLFSEIKKRGLVYAIDLVKHPSARLNQMQLIEVDARDAASRQMLDRIISADPDNLLPGMFPVSDPITVTCKYPCVSCGSHLQLPINVDLSRARVLIEDTGVLAGQVDQSRLIVQNEGDSEADNSPDKHGAFVYSQIAAPGPTGPSNEFGVIPKSNVYVTKAVEDTGGKQYFSMTAIMNGWNLFSAKMAADSSAANTRVVNVSAFGEPVPDPSHPPAIPNDGHLLIVAAAGNDGKEDEPALYAFPRLGNGSTPLIIAGALGEDGQVAGYSNWNSTYVHLFAPGSCVCGAPGRINGTSQAAPFVSTAAAALASMRSAWNPRYVMWRLMATADHPSALQGKAFAGTVNMTRALDPSIIVEEKAADGTTKIHHATSITYDTNWRTSFQVAKVNTTDKEVLRLYAPQPGINSAGVCFTSLEILYALPTSVCVSANSMIELVENGEHTNLSASQILDVILPMPSDNTATLPDVIIASQ